MPTSVRERWLAQLLTELTTRLAPTRVLDNQPEAVSPVNVGADDSIPDQDAVNLIHGDEAPPEEAGLIGVEEILAQPIVRGYVWRKDPTAVRAALNDLLARITAAALANRTLHDGTADLVFDVTPGERGTALWDDEGAGTGGECALTLRVEYRHAEGDPYTLA